MTMTDVGIVLATMAWIVCVSAVYGVATGRSVREVRCEACGFACASVLAACGLAAMLARLCA